MEQKNMKKYLKEKLEPIAKSNILYFILIASFLLFLLTRQPAFGLIIGLSIFALVAVEVGMGIATGGIGKELKEILIALIVALAVWYGSSFLLNTPAPLDAIVSCSMLPHFDRGDLVILQGASVTAPTLQITSDEYKEITSGIALVHFPNGTKQVNGSIVSYCSKNKDDLCSLFLSSPAQFSEERGPLTFTYARCTKVFTASKQEGTTPCVTSVAYKGTVITENLSNDVIVYQPSKDDFYARSGDIIHRALLKLEVNNITYYITKGDNNPIADIQVFDYATGAGNRPAASSQLKGKVLLRVPYIGFFKLFISGMFIEPTGCDTIFSKYMS